MRAEGIAGIERSDWKGGMEAYSTHVVPGRGKPIDMAADTMLAVMLPVLNTILPLRDAALAETAGTAPAATATVRARLFGAVGRVLVTLAMQGRSDGSARWPARS